MKVDVNQAIKDLRGNDVVLPIGGGDPSPLTLQTVIIEALMAENESTKSDSGQEKVARFSLSLRVSDGGEVDFSEEEVKLVKDKVAAFWGALATGRAYDMLEED